MSHDAARPCSRREALRLAGGAVLAAGLAQAVDYLLNLRFTGEEIDYLRKQPAFAHTPPAFFDYLAELRFTARPRAGGPDVTFNTATYGGQDSTCMTVTYTKDNTTSTFCVATAPTPART